MSKQPVTLLPAPPQGSAPAACCTTPDGQALDAAGARRPPAPPHRPPTHASPTPRPRSPLCLRPPPPLPAPACFPCAPPEAPTPSPAPPTPPASSATQRSQ